MKKRGKFIVIEGSDSSGNLGYLENVVQQFLWLTQNREQWVEIFCMADEKNLRSIEDVHRDIIRVLEQKGVLL